MWDVATGKCVATLEGHSDTVRSVAVFSGGRRVVSASKDNTLKVWDVENGKYMAGKYMEYMAELEGHWSTAYGVAVFPDGQRVISASGDKTLKVWDVATGECVATLEGHSSGVRCGVRCTFVMIWLRRRSIVLPSPRTGGASCPRRRTARSSCSHARTKGNQ